MMHKKNEYAFTTQAEAQEFANRYLGPSGRPDRDTYVTGPFYRNGISPVTGDQWQEPHWSVTIEIYS